MAACLVKIGRDVVLRIPYKSQLVVVEKQFFTLNYGKRGVNRWYTLNEEAVRWAMEQLGYRIELTDMAIHTRGEEWDIRFQSERDAALFKLFWC